MATGDNFTDAAPTPWMLYQMATAHFLSRALHLAAKLNIADQLKDGPRHYHELADATATHAPSLRRVLRLLASAGLFAEQADGRLALTPLGQALRADVPGSMRAMVMFSAGIEVQDQW